MYKENKVKRIISTQELIENLDLSLDNISGDSGNKDKHNDDFSKVGEFLSAHGSSESIESEFSIAPEVN